MFVIVILVLLSVLVGASWYLSSRLYQGFAAFFPEARFWQVAVVVGVLILLLMLGFGRSMLPISKNMKYILGIISACCMGVMLYLLLYTLAADLVMLIPRLMKLSFTSHRLFKGFVTVGVLLLTGITCLGGFLNTRRLDVVSYDICLPGKKDISDIRVVMISDLHLGAIGSEEMLETIVNKINALEPDLVCVAGDFFDTDFDSIRDPEAAIKTLQGLRSTYGAYACFGNHDGGQTYSQMAAFLEEAGIRLLEETSVPVDDRLLLVGRLDGSPIGGYGEKKRQTLDQILSREDPTLPVIVLDHNPANIQEYTTEADLILCGHTHKGQVFPGSLLTNLMYTVDYGYYQKDATSPQVIVSSGVGSWGMPIRVGTNCEIVSIEFKG